MKTLSRALAIALVLIFLNACASSRVFMVGAPRPAISSDSVRIYRTPPRRFERIAIINSSSGGSWPFAARGQVDEAISEIKEKAAEIGANGILLEAVGTTSSGNLGIGVGGFRVGGGRRHVHAVGGSGSFFAPIQHKTVQATAIYVR